VRRWRRVSRARPPHCTRRRSWSARAAFSSASTGVAISRRRWGWARGGRRRSRSGWCRSRGHRRDQRDRTAATALARASSLNGHRSSTERRRERRSAGPGGGSRRRTRAWRTLDGGPHLGGGLLALHHHRPDDHPAGQRSRMRLQDVADHRAGGAGDHPDDGGMAGRACLREASNRPRRRGGPSAAPAGQQGPHAGRLHGLDDDLVLRAARIW